MTTLDAPRFPRDPLMLVYHELRAPLGLIATVARTAADECTDLAVRKHWEVVVRAAERSLRTADEVLNLTTNRRPASPRRCYRPTAVVRRLVQDVRALGVPIELSISERARQVAVQGSRQRLEMLAQSLLSNATDHGVAGTTRVEIRADDDAWSLTISNAVAKDRETRGLGLGSYLCARLTADLGGSLTARSDDDVYRVEMRLPLPGARRPAAALVAG